MLETRVINTGYTPRPLQEELHSSLKRFNVLVCHRRFGKTVFSINEMVDRALNCKHHRPQYAYIAPLFSQAKRIAWDYLKDYTRSIPGVVSNETELRVDFPQINGARIMLLGADKSDNLRGMYLDGVIMDEFAEMDPKTWTSVVRPMLSDRNGWAIFIGTPKGPNHFYDIYNQSGKHEDWYRALYDGEKTGIIESSELDRLKAEMDPAEYNQEIRCSFDAALVGSYYIDYIQKSLEEGRIGKVPYDPALPCKTAWDLGIRDSTVIWFFQQQGGNIQCIDYFEAEGKGLDYYAKEILSRGYLIDEHILPWDADARSLDTGKKRVDTLRNLLPGTFRVIPRSPVEDGHQQCRLILPKTWFDADKCATGLEALKHYRRKWNHKKNTFDSGPLHDWSSHGADGFRTLAMGLRDDRSDRKSKPRHANQDYDIFGNVNLTRDRMVL